MTSSLKLSVEKEEKAFTKLVMEQDSRELIEFKNGPNWPGICKAWHEPRIFDGIGTGG